MITIKNARIHNLKGVDVSIPRHKLSVITGVSGSGKSSLAFDTLYEEGKRRYLLFSGTQFMVESAPAFDSIHGLSPTVAVEQRTIRQANPRSTVGTKLKLSSMLAAVYANYGERDAEYEDGLPLDISMFQKNSAKGMCVRCLGKGTLLSLDEEKLFLEKNQPLSELACGLCRRKDNRERMESFCETYGMNLWESRLCDLTEEQLRLLKYGDGGKSDFPGLIPWISMIANGIGSTSGRPAHLLTQAGMLGKCTCTRCNGTGLGEQASHTYFHGYTIRELEDMYIKDLYEFIKQHSDGKNILLDEIRTKLECMMEVGLFYLALSRPLPTLSGGEIQRLFLASHLITEMNSLIFVFDEPTIGLHESEKENLIRSMRRLVDKGNTVVVVEHDKNFMRAADYIVELGPDAGINGGRKIFEGTYSDFIECQTSRTAAYLRSDMRFPGSRKVRFPQEGNSIRIEDANLHNLKRLTVDIPLGVMVGVAGVSGSGKSSLISDTLVPLLKKKLKNKCVLGDKEKENAYEDYETGQTVLCGYEKIKHCYIIDQKPIGRSRTSCPATYTGIFDRIRTLFSESEESLKRGYKPGMFSVNSLGGCKRCGGDGVIHYHVGFGSFIDVACDDCGGTGYVPEAMEVKVDGRNIRDVLEMSVDEAHSFFAGKDKKIERMLEVLQRVGLGYIRLGQATPSISGGESQRIKLAKELAKAVSGRSKGTDKTGTLYIMDEPTTGLSFSDEEKLLLLMDELVDNGASLIVMEHDPFVLSHCDYILELGPGGGSQGGTLLAAGTPDELRKDKKSVIGKYL